MDLLQKHITELVQLLKRKGYAELFWLEDCLPARLTDVLNGQVSVLILSAQEQQEVYFKLLTYALFSSWKESSNICELSICYHQSKGFLIKSVMGCKCSYDKKPLVGFYIYLPAFKMPTRTRLNRLLDRIEPSAFRVAIEIGLSTIKKLLRHE